MTCALAAVWSASVQEAHAAVAQQVQSGTAVNSANGIQVITISSVDTTKSVLCFSTRMDSNRPPGSQLRGRLASATTIEFERVTNGVAPEPVPINIQWYLVTFGSAVKVQRGEVAVTATPLNVTITAVAAVNQAFVLWSKTAAAVDGTYSSDDPVVGELTTTTNLQFRSNVAGGAAHIIAWQVVEFTNAADINVQKGSTSLTAGALSTTATLSPAVNVNKTFVLVGYNNNGTGADIGAKMLRAQLTNSTTITFDRSIASQDAGPDDMTEIHWQAIELKDASIVWSGTSNFAAGVSQATATLSPNVNTTRAVAFGSVQSGGGQNMGRSPYALDDIIGVGSVTAALSTSQITLDRNNTADTADVGWFVVQFDRGSGFKVGSFTKSTAGAPVTQTIAHGLAEVPKALILWTEGRSDETFSSATGITFRAAAQASALSAVLTLTINKPAGTVLNDVMVASIGFRPNTAVITAPAGWTLVRRTDNTGGNSLATYRLVAGASEPGSYAWTFNTSTGSAGGILSFSGVDTTSPVDVELGQNTASALTHAAPSVTTTGANEMIVTSHSFMSGATWTPPTGMTEAVDVSSETVPSCCGQSTEINYVLQAAVGATGIKTATASGDTDSGNTETLVLRPAYPAYFGYGFTDGTTSGSVSTSSQNDAGTSNTSRRMANKALTIVQWGEVTLAEADLQSWDDTNFTLNWTTNNATAYVIHFIAIGGSDILAKVINWQMPIPTGNYAVTGVGFQPNVVIHAHAGSGFVTTPPASSIRAFFGLGVMDADGDQWANGYGSLDAAAPSIAKRNQQTDAAIYAFNTFTGATKKASFVSMDAGGFTVNFTIANEATNSQVISLALKGLNVKAGSFNKTTTTPAPTSQAITGVGFQPSAVLLTSVQDVAEAAAPPPVAHSRFGIGASDGTTQGSSAFSDQDAVTPTNVDAIDKTSKVFVKDDNATATIDAEANLTSVDTDGFTLNWTTNDAVATQILYLAFARLDVTEVRLLSFNGTRYNRGVLLQWKTGYEINNLGFNLYRERNGVRTRVNSSLVAGSGLLAGKGTAVNAEQAYARWDLDSAAMSEGVVYYLEDLDFNGTSTLHGPITPVAGALNAPEPTVTQSSNLGEMGKRKDRKVFFWRDGDREVRRDGRRGAAPVQSALDTQWALAGQAAVKLGIRAPGWYRVPQADLVAAGLDPRVDPRTLRLFVDGVEQAMRVTGQAAGRFVAGDAVEFYATGIDTPYTETRVYWLATLATGVQPGLRVVTTGSAAGGAVADTRGPASFWSTVRRKDRSIYFAALKNGDKENWFGPLVSTDPTDLVLTADHIDRAAPGPAQLEVTLQGVTIDPDVHPNHRVGVLVNGTEVGEMTFDGRVEVAQTFAVPVHVLVDGDNMVTLIARGGDGDYSLADVLGLSYWHTYRANADRLRATVDVPGPVTIGGFASPAIRVVEITNPAAATELRGAVRAEAGGFSSVTVRVSGNGPRTLLAFSDATIASPAFIQANHPSSWHAAGQAHDYVAISHADFVDQVKPLAALREQQGHHAAVVDVEDVYDEFSFGEKTPQAIRDFLRSARTNWRTPPRFVVLVGDATIDPRDYAGMGDADFVPTKQVPMAQVALETASDDWFVDFNGDGLPDVPIGRLSVRTVDQAEAMVGKIVSYDQQSLQPWTKDVLLVADQNDDISNFEQHSTQLSALLPPEYTAHQVFRGALGGDVAHQTLIDRVNDGQLLVNYSGHGSVRIWGKEGDVLTNDDVSASWRNATRLPFVVAMNCLNGFFQGIWDEESLAETLQRAPGGGAVAVWASSSVTPAATQALVNQELFRLIFQGAYATVGEAVAAAKRVVSNPDLRRSWIFFGDPAMHLIGAPQPVSTRSQPSPTPVTPADGMHSPADLNQMATVSAAATLAARPDPVQLADFTADGRADVLVYAASSGRWAAAFNEVAGLTLRAGQWDPAWQVVATDLNGDARADLVFYKPDTGEWVQALTTTTGTSASTRGTLPGGAGLQAQVRVGDFNGDHRDDLLVYDPDTGAWTVGLTDGRGGFTSRRGTWPAGLRVSAGDFNGDSVADVFGYNATTGRGMLALTTRGAQFTVTSADWGPGWRVTVANLDGNTSADLLLYNPVSGSWQEAFNDGSGRFATRTGTWAPGLEVHPTDLDGDGRDDVFAYNPTSGQWLTALNVSAGRFAVTSSVWTPGWAVATGDVNGDGRGDVVLYDPVTGVWFQSVTVGPGIFTYGSGSWLSGAALVGRPR